MSLQRTRFTYLGFELSYSGIEASPDKVKAVQNFPKPQSVKDVRSFLGLASFYRRLVPHFADIAKALTQLTKKEKYGIGTKNVRSHSIS